MHRRIVRAALAVFVVGAASEARPKASVSSPAVVPQTSSVSVPNLVEVLSELRKRGPVGDRKFQLAFRVRQPAVRMSAALRRRYPDVLTIVLQHQFANLVVSRRGFEVDLWFSGKRERVAVPFSAVTHVQDQHVEFEEDV